MDSTPKFIEIDRNDTRVSEVAGVHVRVLGLETIILSKEQANRDKDRATLHILRQTLRLKQGSRE